MKLEFWFDYGSPFAYLGSTQLQRVASEAGAEVEYRPILLGGLFKILEGPMVPIQTYSDAKRQHFMKDMYRWASHWEVPFQFPSRFPMRTIDAMRLTLAALESAREQMPALVTELFADYWVRDRDLADRGVLGAALQRAGLDEALLERIADPEAKKALIDATTAAAERGVFGVPTWGVGDQLFWGQDRIPLVEKALRGWRPQLPEGL